MRLIHGRLRYKAWAKDKNWLPEAELIEGNGYEGRQTSKGELFVKIFGMSRDCEGAHIDFKMVASV